MSKSISRRFVISGIFAVSLAFSRFPAAGDDVVPGGPWSCTATVKYFSGTTVVSQTEVTVYGSTRNDAVAAIDNWADRNCPIGQTPNVGEAACTGPELRSPASRAECRDGHGRFCAYSTFRLRDKEGKVRERLFEGKGVTRLGALLSARLKAVKYANDPARKWKVICKVNASVVLCE